jgi:hypothetical protein
VVILEVEWNVTLTWQRGYTASRMECIRFLRKITKVTKFKLYNNKFGCVSDLTEKKITKPKF